MTALDDLHARLKASVTYEGEPVHIGKIQSLVQVDFRDADGNVHLLQCFNEELLKKLTVGVRVRIVVQGALGIVVDVLPPDVPGKLLP